MPTNISRSFAGSSASFPVLPGFTADRNTFSYSCRPSMDGIGFSKVIFPSSPESDRAPFRSRPWTTRIITLSSFSPRSIPTCGTVRPLLMPTPSTPSEGLRYC